MKLYYSPGACSLSPHIVATEDGLPVELEKVNLAEHKTETDQDYMTVNPKGYVPALRLDDGSVLTEGPAIVQYLADQNPASGLAPKAGTIERYRLQEWLNFIGTELHKNFSSLPFIMPTSMRSLLDSPFGEKSGSVWLRQFEKSAGHGLHARLQQGDHRIV